MTFIPITDFNPPTAGNPRMLYSPDLFDTATGDYPISPLPSTITYPVVAGQIPFFSHAQASFIWPTSNVVTEPDPGGSTTNPANIYDEHPPDPGGDPVTQFTTLCDILVTAAAGETQTEIVTLSFDNIGTIGDVSFNMVSQATGGIHPNPPGAVPFDSFNGYYSLDGGSTWSTLFTHIDTFTIAKSLFTDTISGPIDTSLLKIKLVCTANGGTGDSGTEAKIYAIYLASL
jgi:hypothetical protein